MQLNVHNSRFHDYEVEAVFLCVISFFSSLIEFSKYKIPSLTKLKNSAVINSYTKIIYIFFLMRTCWALMEENIYSCILPYFIFICDHHYLQALGKKTDDHYQYVASHSPFSKSFWQAIVSETAELRLGYWHVFSETCSFFLPPSKLHSIECLSSCHLITIFTITMSASALTFS